VRAYYTHGSEAAGKCASARDVRLTVWESVHPGLRSEKKRENQTRRMVSMATDNFIFDT